jgi:hypothetical protein
MEQNQMIKKNKIIIKIKRKKKKERKINKYYKKMEMKK